VLITVTGLGFGYARFLGKRGPKDAPVGLTLEDDLDGERLTERLLEAGLSESPFWLRFHVALTRAADCAIPGPHLLAKATPSELVAMVCRRAGRPTVKLTFPEGTNRFGIADRLAAAGVASREAFLAASSDRAVLDRVGIAAPKLGDPTLVAAVDSAEGYLFPATYTLHLDGDAAELVKTFVHESDRRFRAEVEAHPKGLAALEALGLDRRAVLVLASMVEKEAAVAEERPLIASVFLNRLSDPAFRRLQSDPTAMYGCLALGARVPACANFHGKASPEINRDAANAYSTYVVDGLPPGPISNPGTASLAAVLAPAQTNYRYFVAKGQGRHTFTATYEEHLAAVKALRHARD